MLIVLISNSGIKKAMDDEDDGNDTYFFLFSSFQTVRKPKLLLIAPNIVVDSVVLFCQLL